MSSSASGYLQDLGRVVGRVIFRSIELVARLIFSVVYHGAKTKVPPIHNKLLRESASTLALKIRTGKVTSVGVVESFIARVKEVNPIINALVDERYVDALQEARAADELIRSGLKTEAQLAKEKPFLGVPFTTKETIEVEGLRFSSGLYERRNLKGAKDADAIRCMKRAGAIIIGITNVPELALWWETYNTIHGRSRNPYDTSRIVGGSSGGEGALLASGASALGLGSDIGGSIRMPCFFNGIFGHKTSKYIVSNDGQFPKATEEEDPYLSIGPMTRYASDLLPTLKVIADKNASKLKLDSKIDIKKVKVYYADDDGGSIFVSSVDQDIKTSMNNVVQYLQKTHGIVAEKVTLDLLQQSEPIWSNKTKSKFGPRMLRLLSNDKGKVNLIWELGKKFLGLSHHTFIALCTAVWECLGPKYGSPAYDEMVRKGDILEKQFKDILGENGVFLYPTHPTPAPYHNEPLIRMFNFSYTAIFNVMGFPVTHIPLGLGSEGLPIGIQAVATTGNDRLTIAMAVELEKAFGGWVPPF